MFRQGGLVEDGVCANLRYSFEPNYVSEKPLSGALEDTLTRFQVVLHEWHRKLDLAAFDMHR